MKTDDPIHALLSALDALKGGSPEFRAQLPNTLLVARTVPQFGPVRDRYPFQRWHFVWRHKPAQSDQTPHFTLDRMTQSMDALWLSADARKAPLAGQRYKLHLDGTVDDPIPEAVHMKRVSGELIASLLISDRKDPNAFGVL